MPPTVPFKPGSTLEENVASEPGAFLTARNEPAAFYSGWSELFLKLGDLNLYGKAMTDITNCTQTVQQAMAEKMEQGIFPTVVLVGRQSAGKSTVLEALTGFRWFPAAKGGTTRRPIKFHFMPPPPQKFPGVVFVDPESGRAPVTLSLTSANAERIHELMHQPAVNKQATGTFTDIPLQAHIFMPGMPSFTLIDTPGLPPGQDDCREDVEKIIESVLKEHLGQSIVCLAMPYVSGGTESLGNDAGFVFVRQWARRQTGGRKLSMLGQLLVVLTKCDEHLENAGPKRSEAVTVLQALLTPDSHELQLPGRVFAVAANPLRESSESHETNVLSDRRIKEQELFESADELSSETLAFCGMQNLAAKIVTLFCDRFLMPGGSGDTLSQAIKDQLAIAERAYAGFNPHMPPILPNDPTFACKARNYFEVVLARGSTSFCGRLRSSYAQPMLFLPDVARSPKALVMAVFGLRVCISARVGDIQCSSGADQAGGAPFKGVFNTKSDQQMSIGALFDTLQCESSASQTGFASYSDHYSPIFGRAAAASINKFPNLLLQVHRLVLNQAQLFWPQYVKAVNTLRTANIPGWLLTAPTDTEKAAEKDFTGTSAVSNAVSVSEVLLLHTMVVEPILNALPDALASMLQKADEAFLSELLVPSDQYLQAEENLQAAKDAKDQVEELLMKLRCGINQK